MQHVTVLRYVILFYTIYMRKHICFFKCLKMCNFRNSVHLKSFIGQMVSPISDLEFVIESK